MAVERLLGGIPLSTFVEDYHLKCPLAISGGCRDLLHLGDWSMLEHLLAQAAADVIVGKQDGQRSDRQPTSESEARTSLAEGYTIGVRQAQRHHPGLAELAASFERDFLSPVDIHLYCTPTESAGFGWHYDAEDVFVLQTTGSKEWWFKKNTVNPWPVMGALPRDMRHEAEMTPPLHCELKAGDWIYLPPGYWHRTRACEESISLSIGIATLTGLDVLDLIRSELVDSLRWRQRLPLLRAETQSDDQSDDARIEPCARAFAELGHDLARHLTSADFARRFLAARRDWLERLR